MAVYPSLRWVKRQLRHNIVSRLSRRRTILAASIIGSEARGTAGPDSDLDIAVVLGGKAHPTALKITERYHAKFRDASSLPKWHERVVDFQFFFMNDEELAIVSKIPLADA